MEKKEGKFEQSSHTPLLKGEEVIRDDGREDVRLSVMT